MAVAKGWCGQSNMAGVADWRDLSAPLSAAQLAHLLFWHLDFQQFSDDVGQLTPMAFDPAFVNPPTSNYDYPMNLGAPAYFYVPYSFGPELYGGNLIQEYLGADTINVKLSPGGTYLKDFPVYSVGYGGQWYQPGSHRSWDTLLPRNITPYTAIPTGSGTASATGVQSLDDAAASWVTNEHIGSWVLCGGNIAQVFSNTATRLNVLVWAPGGLASPPPPGAYTIEKRAPTAASLTKHFIQYCISAAAAAGGGTSNFDMRLVNFQLGESSALTADRAANAKQAMLSCIWYIRNALVSNGLTSLPAHKIGFVLGLIKQSNGVWPFAKQVNDGYREIADGDPFISISEVEDLPLGGRDGTDGVHYNAEGQKTNGLRFGKAGIALLELQPSDPSRKSIVVPGQHRVVRPVWGIGNPIGAFTGYSGLTAATAALRRYPGLYLFRDPQSNEYPTESTPGGLGLRTGETAEIGFASPQQGTAMTRLSTLSMQHQLPRRQQAGVRADSVARGFAPVAGAGSFNAFDEQALVSASTNQTHTIYQSGNVTRIRTAIPSAAIDREWLLRGHRGGVGISGVLRISEHLGTDVDQPWMEHRIGYGDFTEAQAAGIGLTMVSPRLRQDVVTHRPSGVRSLLSRVVGQEFNANSAVPTFLDTLEVDHGAVVEQEAVLWPGVTIDQEVTPNWRGIEGVIRIVQTWTCAFSIGDDISFVAPEITVWGTTDCDRQVMIDALTGTEYDQSWDATNNRYSEWGATTLTTFNKDGTVNATAANPLTGRRGVACWQSTGVIQGPSDGLVWGLYVDAQGTPSYDGIRASAAVIGNQREPAEAPAAGFADYDQRNWAYCRQVSESQGVIFAANTPIKVAAFVCVGTMAQVKAAAAQLAALGVDATWTT